LTDGTANFAFTVRRQEFFVPVGILLKCFLEVSDRELSEKLMACCAEVRTQQQSLLYGKHEHRDLPPLLMTHHYPAQWTAQLLHTY